MAESSIGDGAFAGAGGSPEEGRAASGVGNSTVNSRLSVDLQMLKGLNDELTKLNENTKKIKSNFKSLIKDTKDLTSELNKAATAMGKVSGKSGSSYMDTSKGMPAAASMSEKSDAAVKILKQLQSGGGGLGGGGGGTLGGLSDIKSSFTGGGAFGKTNAVAAAINMINDQVTSRIDSRVDRNKAYAIGADKLSVMLQQTTGLSQNQVSNQMRMPLTKYRLGANGINDLLSLEARTGISAQGNASSVEAMRTLSGFGLSTGQIADSMQQMGSADVVNRMFMMTGTSMYGIGGKQKSQMQVVKDLTKRLGLSNEEILKGGMQQGSVVRQRLEMAGVDEDLQNQILNYAKSNVQFKKKGGTGMYDPSNREHTKLMGVEDNFATQQAETERTGVAREEQMYKRQADNYADMEKNLQKVNVALGKFEDALQGLIGKRTSVRGNLFAKALPFIGGAIGALSMNPGGVAAGVGIGSAVAGMLGDPHGSEANPGRIAEQHPTTKLKNEALVSKLKPVLRDPLARLLADRPGIGVGGTVRSPDEQKRMFLSRYFKTDKQTDTYYEGSYWEKKPGVAKAAPPGLSYHEIGLAADLTFESKADIDWLRANASKYGLDEFSRIGEPWHVQSTAYPSSRRQYEEQGAPYGTTTDPSTRYTPGSFGNIQEISPLGQNSTVDTSLVAMEAAARQSMSLAESMAAFGEGSVSAMSTATSAAGRQDARTDRGTKGGTRNNGNYTVSAGAMDPRDIAVILKRRGFPDDAIWKMLAISHRESRWIPNKHNVNKSTGDDSYGLFQINMLGDLGTSRRKDWAKWLSSDAALLDPINNIHAARLIYGGGNLNPWIPGGKKSGNTWKTGLLQEGIDTGKQIAKDMGLPTTGDPFDKGYSPPSKTAPVATEQRAPATPRANTNNVFNVNPTINITSTGSQTMDVNNIAKEVTKVLEREVRLTAMRNS
jgi:hypothetical protein